MADDKSLVTLLKQKEEDIRAVVPSWLDKDRFIQAAYELRNKWLKDEKLRKCTNESLVNCVYESARTGLEFNAQHAYVTPYGEEATFMPGWRGKVFLKVRSGAVKAIVPDIVYENDEFFIERDSSNPELARLVHRYAKGDRGKPIAAYAMAKLQTGEVDFEVCGKDRIERSRRQSKQPNGLMWGTFWEEAWKKTPIHVLDKRLPEGVDLEAVRAYRLAMALEARVEPGEIENAELTDAELPRAKENHATATVRPNPEEPSGHQEPARSNHRTDNPAVVGVVPVREVAEQPRLHTVVEAIEEVEASESDNREVSADEARLLADAVEKNRTKPKQLAAALDQFGVESYEQLKVSQVPAFLNTIVRGGK